MTGFDSTKFGGAGPIFGVTSNRAKKILNSDIFLVLIAPADQPEFDLHIECDSVRDDLSGIYDRFKKMKPRFWEFIRAISEVQRFSKGEKNKFASDLSGILDVSNTIIAPFVYDNTNFGYAVWGWKSDIEDDDSLMTKSSLIAEQIALSLSASMNEQKTKKQGDKLAALLELSSAIFSSLNYKEVLRKALELAMEIVGANSGTIMLLNKEDDLLEPIMTIDEHHIDAINAMRIKPGEGITGRVAQSGIGIISNSSEDDPRTVHVPGTPTERESLISAPLTSAGAVIGAVTLWSNSGVDFTQEDLEILTIFARQTADAIENSRLYEKLEKAYEELSTTQGKLIMSEKLKALGDMAGGVAHDFNNLLGTILGRIQLLLTTTADPEAKKDLEAIEKAALDGRRTVRRLQNFTQVSSNSELLTIDLNQVIIDAIDHTRHAWKDIVQKKGLTIDLKSSLIPLQPIIGNHDELKEAVSNVILNSVDALESGGNIWVSTSIENNKAILSISDDGVGMEEETQNKLFYPFFTTKKSRGSGMGLAVVYGILLRHHVDISVESAPGKGSKFLFKFNMVDQADLTAQPEPAPLDLGRLSILLIDDDSNLLDVVGDMIDYLDHDCIKAVGGKEALRILENQSFDLVVTDLGMPDIGGWDVADFCRQVYPDMPIILISGWGAQIDCSEAMEKVDAVLPKPFMINEFKNVINKVVSKSKDPEKVLQ